MINRKQLLAINDLKLSGSLEQMSDSQLSEYNKNLDEFVDGYPAYEMELKRAFVVKDYAGLSKTSLSLRNILSLMYAEELEQGCLKLLGDIQTGGYEATEAYFTYFLTTLSALSIAIQIAQHKEDKDEGTAVHSPAPAETVVHSPAPAEESDRRYSQKTVLAVDDTSIILSSLKTFLQGTQYKFAGVSSAAAALKYIQDHRPDLFLLDIEMPEMDGYELAARIRQSGHTAPIVFLTGNSSKEYVMKAIRAGAADFIVKPVNRVQVLGKIIKYTI